jgi:hypothetical protein
MAKHNKKRNTAFIYETLIREVVKQTISKDKAKRNVAIGIIKEHFKQNTELHKELQLYKSLIKTKNLNERIAEKLVYETMKQHRAVDKQKLFKEQSDVISSINKNLSKTCFNNFVPNYKNLATIAQIFDDGLSPKAKVLLETKLINKLSERSEPKTNEVKVSGLVVKKFINRFNDSYGELMNEQKELLSKFVTSFQDNGAEFKFYLNEEIGRLKKCLKDVNTVKEIKEDTSLQQKVTDVLELLEGFNKSPVDREKILQVLHVQNLIKEIQA